MEVTQPNPKAFAPQAKLLAQAWLEAMERGSAAGFTGVEEQIAVDASRRTSCDDILVKRHYAGQSWQEIAKETHRTAKTVERLYNEALDELAQRLAPRLHQCCSACREKYPDVISDPFLRCDQCRSELANRAMMGCWKPVNAGVTARLEGCYELLGMKPADSYEDIKSSYENMVCKDSDDIIHKAWRMIHLHRSLYGDNSAALRATIPLCLMAGC